MRTASYVASHSLSSLEQLIHQWSRVVEDTIPQVLLPPTIPFVHMKGHLSGVVPHMLSSLFFSDSLRSFESLFIPVRRASSVNVLALIRLLTSL